LIIGIIMAFILGKDPSYKTKITKQ
jgi:hypothetical protein